MHATTILAFAFGLAPVALANTGPFFDYCTSNSLDYSTIISQCTNGQSTIDLNGEISNQNGQLVWSSDGGYFQSCADAAGGHCDLNYSTLECDCLDDQGGSIRTSIGLNAHLWYNTDTNRLFWN